jgi:hypothetical protein
MSAASILSLVFFLDDDDDLVFSSLSPVFLVFYFASGIAYLLISLFSRAMAIPSTFF